MEKYSVIQVHESICTVVENRNIVLLNQLTVPSPLHTLCSPLCSETLLSALAQRAQSGQQVRGPPHAIGRGLAGTNTTTSR